MPMIACEVTDLPEPDSPTSATVSRDTLKEMSDSAGTGLPCSEKSTASRLTSSNGCDSFVTEMIPRPIEPGLFILRLV